ncbi:MAG TPA: YbaL family putative K(+) efflux transporter [Lysobacter sp.]|nr:YbaL family putative K(+) efflux transporter [Lysobacter sp.]
MAPALDGPLVHHTSLIALLVAGFVLAFVFGGIAHRLRLSPLVGYLLAGVVLGPFTPGFVADASLAPQLAEVGVILLMFGVGLHFSVRDLLAVKGIAVPGALAQIVVVSALGWGLARGFGWSHAAGIVFGLALSVASTVVVLRGLEERRLLDSGRGRIAVGWLIFEDLAMVLALVLLPALGGRGGGLGAALLLTVAKVGGFVVVMMLVGRRVIPWVLERMAGTGSRELFTLCVLAIALGVAFGSAELFGVSFALGAFFAGLLLNESEFSHQAANETLPLRDAFAVLFFISVGMLFDPAILLEQPVRVLATALVVVLGNALVAWGAARLLGAGRTGSTLLAVSLCQIGEFSFILAGLGVSLRMLPAEGRDLILAAAILSIMVNPLMLALHDRLAARRERSEPPAPHDVMRPPLPDGARPHVILIGYGRVGSELGPLLASHGVPVVVIDDDEPRVQNARAAGLPAVRGHAANAAVIAEAHPDTAQMALIAIPNAFETGEIIERLRAANPRISIMARAHSDAGVRYLIDRGADGAVMAERELAHSLAEMVMALPAFRGTRSLPQAGAG